MQIKVPHQVSYGMEHLFLSNPSETRRVFHEHEWYYFKGTEGDKDVLEKIPYEVLKAEQDKVDAEVAERIEEKGHDCEEFVCHGMYDRGNGSLNDYYYCGECDALLQTG